MMTHRSIVGWIFAALWLVALPAWAVEYRLQVANLDFLTLSGSLDNSTHVRRGEADTGRMAARSDNVEFTASAMIPGREVQLLKDSRYGGKPPTGLAVFPVTREQAWTTLVWEGNPGDTVAFVVKSELKAWQEVVAVAANPEGVLRRLSIGGPSLFGRQRREVPEVSYDFLLDAADRGTFPGWLERNSTAIDGMSLVVGRGRNRIDDPDRVYAVIKLPSEPRNFKLVIGWRDHPRPTGSD